MSDIPARERDYIRELARQVAGIAASEENRRRIRRWQDVNALRRPDRAPVWCKPVGAWKELLPADALRCTDRWLRGVEYGLRQTLIKHEIGDDSPVASHFPVAVALDVDPPNWWGVDVTKEKPKDAGGSWRYVPPLKTAADFDRLRVPRFTHNPAKTQERLARAFDLLGDILPPRAECDGPLSGTLGTYAADLRGLEQMMMDMAVEPELMHRLMAHVRDSVLEANRAVERAGILTRNNNGPMYCSDDFGPDPKGGPLSLKNLWINVNSQEFDQVSPPMWEEFCLSYQRPVIEQFGLSAYGCCENLSRKLDGVLTIPNLRIVVCSAWTGLDVVLEKTDPKKHCIMWRQKASDVVFPDDESVLRKQLEEGARKLQGRPCQIVLRELQTLAGHPDRLHVWTRLAKEAAERNA